VDAGQLVSLLVSLLAAVIVGVFSLIGVRRSLGCCESNDGLRLFIYPIASK